MALPENALLAAYSFFGEQIVREIMAGTANDAMELSTVAGRVGMFLRERSDLFNTPQREDIQRIEELGMRLFFPDAQPQLFMQTVKQTLGLLAKQ